MAEMGKVLYVVVVDEEDEREKGKDSYRYTRPVLQSTLQLMGCKARHAFKISQSVFGLIRSGSSADSFLSDQTGKSDLDASNGQLGKEDVVETCMDTSEFAKVSGKENNSDNAPFELYKRRTTVVVKRRTFLDIVCDILSEYKYVGPNQRADLELACRIRERKESVTVLLCGTSGCGKSTLSALLGTRLGITTVISTDSIRHMMRSFVDEKQNPLLWASTYHAGECLDPVSVAEAKAKTKLKELSKNETPDKSSIGRPNHTAEVGSGVTELISQKQMAIEGYKAQSEMVIDSLDRLITAWEERKESVVVEGVHLSLNFVMGLMRKHPSIVPFMIYITNEAKHLERFAVRAKYMTLDPAKNKYIKYIKNIRTIQEYLCKRADKHLVPKINNTNVDKSVAAIHATVFGCLRRRETGEQLHDSSTNKVTVVEDEYRNQCAANSLSSKGMFQLIQRQDSSRHLMALVKSDGSVAKAWPVDSYNHGKPSLVNIMENGTGAPMYGPLQIGRSEPVNLQFGFYGVSAWPSDGGTSRAGSVDESRADGTDTGSKYLSSFCSLPRLPDGTSKEVKEENSVHGSDEEPDDDSPGASSDEDMSDDNDKQLHDEIGSVDEESTKSDEEYDDLAMQDVQENGYKSDHEDENRIAPVTREDQSTQKQDHSSRTKSEPLSKALCSYSSLLMEKSDTKISSSVSVKARQRSLSISSMDNYGSVINDPIVSGAP